MKNSTLHNLNLAKLSILPVAVVIVGIVVGLLLYGQIWFLDDQGLSIETRTTPYWDFNNLWSGSLMAIEGHVEWLFDADLYREELRNRINPNIPNHEWGYPPSLLIIGTPLALFPELYAYIIWTFATVGLLYLAIKTLDLPKHITFAIVLCPAAIINAAHGQNGAFTAGLLIAGLSLAPKKPVLAGICFGVLTIKPQLGVLIPFFLIASGNWRAVISAGITTVVILVATGVLFGFNTWTLFFTQTQPLMREIMDAPFMQPYQINAATIFVSMRSFGIGLTQAYFVQGLFAIASIGVGMWIWRKNCHMDHRIRVAFSCVLVLLATPYGYTYDLIPLSVAIGIFYALIPKLKFSILIALIWLSPLFNHAIVLKLAINHVGFVTLALLGLMVWSYKVSTTNAASSPMQP